MRAAPRVTAAASCGATARHPFTGNPQRAGPPTRNSTGGPRCSLRVGVAASGAKRRTTCHRTTARPPRRSAASPSSTGHAGGRHRAGIPQRVLEQPRGRHLRRRRLGSAAVLVDRQVRQRHRMAELHEADRARRGHDQDRLDALHDAHRGAVERAPTATSATSSTTARADAGGQRYCMNSAALRFVPARRARGAGIRRVPRTVRDGRHHSTRGARIMTSGPTTRTITRTPAPRRPSWPAGASGAWRTSSAASPACSTPASATPAATNAHATYRNHPGHAEAVEIVFDPDADDVPRHPGVLLPDPRPVDAGPPGQRHRHELPLGDLPALAEQERSPATRSRTSTPRACGRARP